jgi:hypothetical protein
MQCSIADWLKKKKLATSKYNPKKANNAYPFILATFKPRVKSDPNDDEGGSDETIESQSGQVKDVGLHFTTHRSGPNAIQPLRLPPRNPDMDDLLSHSTAAAITIVDVPEEVEEDINDVRVFCPEQHRKPLLCMVQKHANAHPLIPGDHAPTPDGVRHWAVWKAFHFCYDHGLPELWAYLWCNWYRLGRWVLWAWSACGDIPHLRTTMFVEAQ